jgi:hypothetical protein
METIVRKNTTFNWGRGITMSPWTYASAASAGGLFLLIRFAALPLAAQGYTIPISPVLPQAQPGTATSQFLTNLNAQDLGAMALGYVSHPYLTGQGTVLAFEGDNIQIFEYPSSEIAHSEALAIFKRAPGLAVKNYFHVFQQNNLIGLYFGHNNVVLEVTEENMGPPLPSSTVK